ncbi:MAG: hypothetical protein C1O27_000749 [Chloroflexi bacterium]|jgi:hypothetical protein|nr:MAG: hypothetical protein C1O27_000749 [Chloroflexota bacterium]
MGQSLSIEINDPAGLMQIRATPLEAIRGPLALIALTAAHSAKEALGLEGLPYPYQHVGQEYLLVRMHFQYLKGPDADTQYKLSISDFSAVSSSGREYETPLLIAPDPVLRANLYPGASRTGWGVWEIDKADIHPLLTIGRDSSGRGGIWWSISPLVLPIPTPTLPADFTDEERVLGNRAQEAMPELAARDLFAYYTFMSPRYRGLCPFHRFEAPMEAAWERVEALLGRLYNGVASVSLEGGIAMVYAAEPIERTTTPDWLGKPEGDRWVFLEKDWWIEPEGWAAGCP